MKPSRYNKCVLIMYVYDANSIWAEPLKSRSGRHILEAHIKQVKRLTTRGYVPRVYWLDNEASAILKTYNHQEDIRYQLLLPHIHRVNAEEQAIRTWKDKFIAVM